MNNPTIEIREILRELIVLRDKIAGCGNGRVMVDKFIQDLQRDYEIE